MLVQRMGVDRAQSDTERGGRIQGMTIWHTTQPSTDIRQTRQRERLHADHERHDIFMLIVYLFWIYKCGLTENPNQICPAISRLMG